jgi:hypothetical protein
MMMEIIGSEDEEDAVEEDLDDDIESMYDPDIWLAVHHSITFLLLPTRYTNFLFIHINYIKLNSSKFVYQVGNNKKVYVRCC